MTRNRRCFPVAIIEWRDAQFILGVDEMDDTHREFVDMVNSLEKASNADFIQNFDALIEHTRAHFENEDRLMAEYGFPAIAEHRGEHDRVLGEMTRFNRVLHKGLVSFARSYVDESLKQWFPLHAATMDSALAAHLKSRISGAKTIPVNIK